MLRLVTAHVIAVDDRVLVIWRLQDGIVRVLRTVLAGYCARKRKEYHPNFIPDSLQCWHFCFCSFETTPAHKDHVSIPPRQNLHRTDAASHSSPARPRSCGDTLHRWRTESSPCPPEFSAHSRRKSCPRRRRPARPS